MTPTRRMIVACLLGGLLAFVAAAQTPAGNSQKPAPSKPAPTPSPAPAGKKPVRIDINSASKAQLMKLPGIREATAQKIIEGRPYRNKAQLKSRHILAKPAYDKIAARVIAKQKKSKTTGGS